MPFHNISDKQLKNFFSELYLKEPQSEVLAKCYAMASKGILANEIIEFTKSQEIDKDFWGDLENCSWVEVISPKLQKFWKPFLATFSNQTPCFLGFQDGLQDETDFGNVLTSIFKCCNLKLCPWINCGKYLNCHI